MERRKSSLRDPGGPLEPPVSGSGCDSLRRDGLGGMRGVVPATSCELHGAVNTLNMG